MSFVKFVEKIFCFRAEKILKGPCAYLQEGGGGRMLEKTIFFFILGWSRSKMIQREQKKLSLNF